MQKGVWNRGTTYRAQEAVDIGLCDRVGIATRNAITDGRIAALLSDDQKNEITPVEIDLSLIQPLATGYKPPLPTDFTRLVAANLPAPKKGN